MCPATASQSLSRKGCCVYHVKGGKEELQDYCPEGAQRGQGWWHGVKIRIPTNSAWPTELPPKMEKWGEGMSSQHHPLVFLQCTLNMHGKHQRSCLSFDEDVEYEVRRHSTGGPRWK